MLQREREETVSAREFQEKENMRKIITHLLTGSDNFRISSGEVKTKKPLAFPELFLMRGHQQGLESLSNSNYNSFLPTHLRNEDVSMAFSY